MRGKEGKGKAEEGNRMKWKKWKLNEKQKPTIKRKQSLPDQRNANRKKTGRKRVEERKEQGMEWKEIQERQLRKKKNKA